MYSDFYFNYKFDPQFWKTQCDTFTFKKVRQDTLTSL